MLRGKLTAGWNTSWSHGSATPADASQEGNLPVPRTPLVVLESLFQGDRAQILKLCNLAQLCPSPQGFNEGLGSTLRG